MSFFIPLLRKYLTPSAALFPVKLITPSLVTCISNVSGFPAAGLSKPLTSIVITTGSAKFVFGIVQPILSVVVNLPL